jgi:SAM-dependent methyltransferase
MMEAVADTPVEHRFYGELAVWWPLISSPGEYAEEAAFAATLLGSAVVPVREVLELGSGGGNNALHLKARFALTLVDLSEEMLGVSRRLNPECKHLQGDMRTLRLGRAFDAVFVHDAVEYMTNADDLRQAIETAFAHCRPGGVAVFVPDRIAETFEPDTDHGGSDAADGRGVRYLQWEWDPDPGDSWTVTEYVFLLRDTDGSIDVVHETHRLGLFGHDVWLRLLESAGFAASAVAEETSEDRVPRVFFVGHRPVVAAGLGHEDRPARLDADLGPDRIGYTGGVDTDEKEIR